MTDISAKTKNRLKRAAVLAAISTAASAILLPALILIVYNWAILSGFVMKQPAIATLIAAIFSQIVAIFIAVHSMNRSRNTSLIAKTVDVSMHCTQRYEKLQARRAEIDQRERASRLIEDAGKKKKELEEIGFLEEDYETSFWAIKSDQFDFWLVGALDHDTFFDWSYYLAIKYLKQIRHKEANQPVGEKDANQSLEQEWSISESWARWRGREGRLSHGGSNPQFVAFVEKLMATTEDHAKTGGAFGEIPLAKAILKIMKRMEGSALFPGFSRKYRRLAWGGFHFKMYFERMYEDLDEEERARRNGSTHSRM